MTNFNRDRQKLSAQQFAGFCISMLSLFLPRPELTAQEEATVEEQLRRQIPSATAIDRQVFEKIARAAEAPNRDTFDSHSLTAELMFLNHKTAQDSQGQFRFLTEGRMPKPAEFAQEMYRSIGGGRFRIVTHPVTMIQAERITGLEAEVDGNTATGSFEFHVPELYEGKADFTAEKSGGEWRFTRFQMPKLDIDIRSDESGHWWRTEDLQGFDLPKCLIGHTGTVWSLDFSKDGQRLVSGSNDGTVRIWNVAERTTALTISQAHKPNPAAPRSGGVLSVCFSPDGKSIATAGDDGTAKIWDAQSGELQFEIPIKNIVSQAIYTLDGKSLAVASGELKVWDISREAGLTIDAQSFPTIAVSPDGKTLVSAGEESNRKTSRENRDYLKLFEMTTGRELAVSTASHEILVTDVRFSPDGKRIASCSRDRTIKTWDAKSLRLLTMIEAREAVFQSLSWSPDGHWIVGGGWVVGGDHDEGTHTWNGGVYIWNSATGKLRAKLPEHPQGIRCVTYCPNGKQIVAAGDDGVIRLWKCESEGE